MNRNNYRRQIARRKARTKAEKEPHPFIAWLRRVLAGKPALYRTRYGEQYVVDPETGQWWRRHKWEARQASR